MWAIFWKLNFSFTEKLSELFSFLIVNFGITIGTYIAKPEYYENYMEKKNIKSIINYSFKYSGIIFLINSISLIVASYLYINYECKNISKDIDIF